MIDSVGFFLLYRQIWESDLSPIVQGRKFTEMEAWLYLISEASTKDRYKFFNGLKVPLKRGELVTSTRDLAAVWKWDKKTVAKLLNSFACENDPKITVVSRTKKWTTLKINNYERFQGFKKSERTTESPTESPTDWTTEGPLKDHSYIKEQRITNNDLSLYVEKPKLDVSSESDPEALDFSRKGLKYAGDSNNPNLQRYDWVAGYLKNKLIEIRNNRPEMSPEILLKIWQECCDDASAKAVSSPKWYRTTFENRVAEWRPGNKSTASSSKAKPSEPVQLAAWRAGQKLQYILTNQVFMAEELTLCRVGFRKPDEKKPDGFLMPDKAAGYFNHFKVV